MPFAVTPSRALTPARHHDNAYRRSAGAAMISIIPDDAPPMGAELAARLMPIKPPMANSLLGRYRAALSVLTWYGYMLLLVTGFQLRLRNFAARYRMNNDAMK